MYITRVDAHKTVDFARHDQIDSRIRRIIGHNGEMLDQSLAATICGIDHYADFVLATGRDLPRIGGD